jgi:dTDP-L-rhamnose 4-epimerase
MVSVVITGGAGFIGKRLALNLLKTGHEVTVFDNLQPQVHSDPDATVSELINAGAIFIHGDVLDPDAVLEAVFAARPKIVIHLASETGTGQSYDLPAHYCNVNVTGTARLVEAIRTARADGIDVRRVILASSRAVYGEGAGLDPDGRVVAFVQRNPADMARGDFAAKDALGGNVTPIPSSSALTAPIPASIYASTKLMQEYVLCQGFYQSPVEVSILRLQNVYGAGQSINSPYTGVLSIFAKQLLDGSTLNIYEDGEIVRDFVHVSDVVTAFSKLCDVAKAPSEVLDIGSGEASSILNVARMMISTLGLDGDRLRISGQFRPGDVRYAVANIAAAKSLLGWAPGVSLADGVNEILEWERNGK